MRLLLTGFEKFGELPLNPSELVVRAMARDPAIPDLVVEVLPTVYDAAGARIRALLERHRPDLVLMTGVAAKRTEINLERVALNLDDADKPDNAGVLRTDAAIEPQGPLARRTTCDLAPALAALRAADIPAVISNHAGGFVCNHTYYCALAHRTPAVFVHLPMVNADWTVERLTQGIRLVIGALAPQMRRRDSTNGDAILNSIVRLG